MAAPTLMIHSATTTNKEGAVSPLVNVERITSVDVVKTLKVAGNGTPAKNEIHFTMAQDLKTGVPGKAVWQYADAATLDADYLLVVNTVSTLVA